MKAQVFKLFLVLQFIGCGLLSKTMDFSGFMQAPLSKVYENQKTLIFDSNRNQFKLIFCYEIPFSYQQCLKYNYYLFLNFHVDSNVQKSSPFSYQLIKSWLFHKSSVYWLNLIFVEDLKYLNSNFYGVQKKD